MSSLTNEHAAAILKPFVDSYVETFNSGSFGKMEDFYDANSVMVEKDKSVLFGKKDIAKSLEQLATDCGKTVMKISNSKYEGVGDYINMFTDFEFHTEKAGVLKGSYIQIWRKVNDVYVIYHDEYQLL
ncbi:unnamed protein product [Auanema sp. JU1783]|nr:unnamed protein product [Auanema sp. JU1783]